MVKLEWFHFCEYSFLTATHKPGVIGIHEGILAAEFPAPIPIGFAFQVRGKPHQVIPIALQFCRPNGESLAKLDGQQTANEEGAAVVQMSFSLLVEEPGRYVLKIAAAGMDLPSQSIRVILSPAPQTPTAKPH